MTTQKNGEFNYGLDIDKVMKRPKRSTELQAVLRPGVNHTLYVVALSDRGVDGTVRAEFKPAEDHLVYTINGFEFNCGSLLKLD